MNELEYAKAVLLQLQGYQEVKRTEGYYSSVLFDEVLAETERRIKQFEKE